MRTQSNILPLMQLYPTSFHDTSPLVMRYENNILKQLMRWKPLFVQLPLLQWPYPLMDSNEGLLYFLLILDDYSKPTKEDTAWLKSCSWL